MPDLFPSFLTLTFTSLIRLSTSYVEYDNGYYVGVWAGTGDVQSHQDASEYCSETMGTNLASIHSDTENNYAIDAAIGTGANISTDTSEDGAEWVWIGLNDRSNEGTYVWDDGTVVNYIAWSNNEPEGENNQDCVHIWRYNQWADISCAGSNPETTVFVCNRLYVPEPDECIAYWMKTSDGSEFVRFFWGNETIPESEDLSDYAFYLGYYVDGNLQYTTLDISLSFKDVGDFDRSVGVDAIAGTIQILSNKYTETRYSNEVDCISVTMEPTIEPTQNPTYRPTSVPSTLPTMSPTWDAPYLFIGGDICSSSRCDCSGSDLGCVGDDVYTIWSEDADHIVTFEQRELDFGYPTQIFWDIKYIGGSNESNNTSAETVDPNYSKTISFSPSNGYLNVSTSNGGTSNNGKQSISISDSISAPEKGLFIWKLTLHNCSIYDKHSFDSKDYTNCSIVYPNEIFIKIDTTDNQDDETINVTEREFPSWLWWVIAGLVIFAALLLFLIYRSWLNNRQKKQALAQKRGDLEHAIEEAENGGFGAGMNESNTNFNPLAVGSTGNKADNNDGFNNTGYQSQAIKDRADVYVDKFNQKQQFGPVAPARTARV